MLVAAKKLGFSLNEIARFNVDEMTNLIDVSIPEFHDPKKPKRRKATQKDIDWLMG